MAEHFPGQPIAVVMKAVVLILLAVAAIVPADAGAQQVRIVADGTAIRLDPNATSPIIVEMASGTLLEYTGESGAWYAVSIIGDPSQEEVIGYVLASEVELVGAVPGIAPPVGSIPATGPGPVIGIPSLQEQYEDARARRSSGVSKVIWGLVFVGSSYAALEFVPPLQVPVAEDYDDAESYQSALDRRSAAETGRSVGMALGGALGAWGVAQITMGWSSMRSLELELPRTAGPSLQVQYGDAFRMRSSGRKKVFWAVFLPLVAYGAVEWVPYLGVPDAADFDNAEDFQAAQDRRDRAETARSGAYILGIGLGAWGTTQWVLGARRMSGIEATARMSSLSVPVGSFVAEAPVELFANRRGPRTQFGVSWSW
ncbi:MAG: hypothetical protein OXE96_01595 [Gemmatimonadetes bacterium]|nr:hypothetical protein [Gemmatimonadota bacterium]